MDQQEPKLQKFFFEKAIIWFCVYHTKFVLNTLYIEAPLHARSYAVNEDSKTRFLINVEMDIAKLSDRNSGRHDFKPREYV